MREFQIPDVLSAMKILYSMAEFGIGDMGGQIDALVQRNTVMMDRAERLKEEGYDGRCWVSCTASNDHGSRKNARRSGTGHFGDFVCCKYNLEGLREKRAIS